MSSSKFFSGNQWVKWVNLYDYFRKPAIQINRPAVMTLGFCPQIRDRVLHRTRGRIIINGEVPLEDFSYQYLQDPVGTTAISIASSNKMSTADLLYPEFIPFFSEKSVSLNIYELTTIFEEFARENSFVETINQKYPDRLLRYVVKPAVPLYSQLLTKIVSARSSNVTLTPLEKENLHGLLILLRAHRLDSSSWQLDVPEPFQRCKIGNWDYFQTRL